MQRRIRSAWIAPPMVAAVALTQLPGSIPGQVADALAAGPALAWEDPVAMPPCESPLAGGRTTAGGGTPAGDVPAAGAAPQTATGAAWRLSPVLDDDGSLAGWDLVTSAPGAGAAALRLSPESAVRGPVDGLLAVAEDDGTESVLSLIAPAFGCRQVISRQSEVARQAIWIPLLGALAVHSVRREDRSDIGTWLVDASGRGPARPLLPPLTPDSAVTAQIGRAWVTELVLDAAGELLAVQSCGERSCRSRIVPLGGGPVVSPDIQPDGALIGLDGTHLIGFDACPGLPCPLRAGRLEDATVRMLAAEVTSATTLLLDGHLVVVASLLESGHSQLVAMDPADGRRQRLGAVPVSLSLLRQAGESGSGISAGGGWLPVMDQDDGRPFALDPGRISFTTQGEVDR